LLNASSGEPDTHEPFTEDENYDSIVSHTAHKNVDIIGSHRGTNSPSEILSGRNFSGMLKSLMNDYDYIIMEGASMNDFPDTKELVGYADLVLPVFSAESEIRQSDKESIKYLQSLNGKLVGAILNKVESKNLKI
jgi:succinoglycan biosynthesis transport protein ExoP